MLSPELQNRVYTAEVLRTRGDPQKIIDAIGKLTATPIDTDEMAGDAGMTVRLHHALFASERAFHRSSRRITTESGSILIPREKSIRRRTHWLYDVLIGQFAQHTLIAVPFHGMAEDFFIRVDEALAGMKIVYEQLNITRLVMKLGPKGTVAIQRDDDEVKICVTQCQLAYSDPNRTGRNLQQVRMTGSNLGASDVYQMLVEPVLRPEKSSIIVTPNVLGFAMMSNGVKKTSTTTDRHGNFKLWIGPGLRQLVRVFDLLTVIGKLDGIAGTTTNVPILQSEKIREVEG